MPLPGGGSIDVTSNERFVVLMITMENGLRLGFNLPYESAEVVRNGLDIAMSEVREFERQTSWGDPAAITEHVDEHGNLVRTEWGKPS